MKEILDLEIFKMQISKLATTNFHSKQEKCHGNGYLGLQPSAITI